MTLEKRTAMIVDYARKVVMYPQGSKGYDPVDMVNLKDALRRYDDELRSGFKPQPITQEVLNNTKKHRLPQVVTTNPVILAELDEAWRSALIKSGIYNNPLPSYEFNQEDEKGENN